MVNNLKLKAGVLIYTFVACVYLGGGPLTFIRDTVALVVSVFALYIMYMFFKSRPYTQQTVIIGLMKMLVFFVLLGVIKRYIQSISINVFVNTFKALFIEHPTLICSIFTPRWILLGSFTTLCWITISKTFLILFPHKFLNLQHEKWIRAGIGLTLIVIAADICIHTGLNGHYCLHRFSFHLANEIGVEVTMSTFKSVPWFLIIILTVGESTSFIVQQYRAWRQIVNIVPVQIPIAVIVPSIGTPGPAAANGGWVGSPGPAAHGGLTGNPGPGVHGGGVGNPGPAAHGGGVGNPDPAAHGGWVGNPGPAANGGWVGNPVPAAHRGLTGNTAPGVHGGWVGNPGPAAHGGWVGNPGPAAHRGWVRNPGPAAHGVGVGNQQEDQNTSERKLSRNITLLMASLDIMTTIMLDNVPTSETVDFKFILFHVKMFIIRFQTNALPLVWILSTDETLEFAFQQCRVMLNLNFWPQAIRDYFSLNL